jgi:hypothetical protein
VTDKAENPGFPLRSTEEFDEMEVKLKKSKRFRAKVENFVGQF